MANPWLPRFNDGVVRFDRGWLFPTEAEIAAARNQPILKGTMKRQNWYPSRIADQIPWLENFRTKLPGYEVILGLTGAKVDACVASCRYLIYVLSEWLSAARAFGPASTEAVDLLMSGSAPAGVPLPSFTAPALPQGVVIVPPGVLTRLFDLVTEIKDADGYNDTIGLDLQIIGSPSASDHPVPTMKLELQQGAGCQSVKITFKKFGHQGVYIESRRGNGAWEFLAIDTETPQLDERPLLVAGTPEVREYRLRFWDKGTPNGDWTDVAKITVAP